MHVKSKNAITLVIFAVVFTLIGNRGAGQSSTGTRKGYVGILLVFIKFKHSKLYGSPA